MKCSHNFMINVGTTILLFMIQKIQFCCKNPAQPAELPFNISKIDPKEKNLVWTTLSQLLSSR